MSLLRKFSVVCLVVILAGCGFKPIYGGKSGGALTSDLNTINITPIKDRVGQILRNDLEGKLDPRGSGRKKFFDLRIDLTESKQELAVKKSEIATRANLQLVAKYILVNNKSGKSVTSGSSRSTVGYNILTQNYATLIAEKDARQRAAKELSTDITNRLAAYFQLRRGKSASVK